MTNKPVKSLMNAFCFLIVLKTNGQGLTNKYNHIERNGKSSVGTHSYRGSKLTSSSQSVQINLNIVRPDNSLLVADGIFAEFNDIYSAAVDMYDAIKFTNSNENICFLRNGISLAAERRPFITQFDTLFLKLWRTRVQNYQFEITPDAFYDTDISLQDAYLNTTTTLNSLGSTIINFAIDDNAASADVNRFRVIFRKNIALPVIISSINATAQNNTIAVEWKVENELNIEKYEVERSSDANDFSTLGAVSITENNTLRHAYKWLDLTAAQGTNFYRIKIYDRSGEIKYSPVVKAVITKTGGSSINIYPNPVKNNIINLRLGNQPKGTYQLRLSNNSGQVMLIGSLVSNDGNGTLPVNIPTNLITGIYQLEVLTPGNKREIKKVMIK